MSGARIIDGKALAAKLRGRVAAQVALGASLQDTDMLLQRVRMLVEERERMRGLLEDSLGLYC